MSIELSNELTRIENCIIDNVITSHDFNQNNICGIIKTTLTTPPSKNDEYNLQKNIETKLIEYYKINKQLLFYPKVETLQYFIVSRPYSNKIFNDEERMFLMLTLGLALICYIPVYIKRYYKWYTTIEYRAFKYNIHLRRSNVEVITNIN